MKYVSKQMSRISFVTSLSPFKSVVNNGYTIRTTSDLLLKQLYNNEYHNGRDIIDWHLFKPYSTVLVDNYGYEYVCTHMSYQHSVTLVQIKESWL